MMFVKKTNFVKIHSKKIITFLKNIITGKKFYLTLTIINI